MLCRYDALKDYPAFNPPLFFQLNLKFFQLELIDGRRRAGDNQPKSLIEKIIQPAGFSRLSL